MSANGGEVWVPIWQGAGRRPATDVERALVEVLTNVKSSIYIDDHGEWYLSNDFDFDKLCAALKAAGVEL